MPLTVLSRGAGFKVLWSWKWIVSRDEKGHPGAAGESLGQSGGSGGEEQWDHFRRSTVTQTECVKTQACHVCAINTPPGQKRPPHGTLAVVIIATPVGLCSGLKSLAQKAHHRHPPQAPATLGPPHDKDHQHLTSHWQQLSAGLRAKDTTKPFPDRLGPRLGPRRGHSTTLVPGGIPSGNQEDNR